MNSLLVLSTRESCMFRVLWGALRRIGVIISFSSESHMRFDVQASFSQSPTSPIHHREANVKI